MTTGLEKGRTLRHLTTGLKEDRTVRHLTRGLKKDHTGRHLTTGLDKDRTVRHLTTGLEKDHTARASPGIFPGWVKGVYFGLSRGGSETKFLLIYMVKIRKLPSQGGSADPL